MICSFCEKDELLDEKSWYVYILECGDDSLYTGITNDLNKRMKAHKSGKGSKYVKGKGFGRLLHAIKMFDKISAAKLEYQIKQMDRNEKITFFIKHPDLDYSVLKKQNLGDLSS